MTTDPSPEAQRALDALNSINTWDQVQDLARAVLPEPGSDALLASVMRKLLAAEYGYSNWGGRTNGRFWVTVDVRQLDITAEEMQAIDDAAPAS